MESAKIKSLITEEIQSKSGVLRLAPAWVGRTILLPGKRLKLDVRDLYARGAEYGAISERWMASTDMVDNGPTTLENEGMSFIVVQTDTGIEKVLLKEAIQELGNQILGEAIMDKHGCLVSFAKFYDFQTPIPHHVHLMEEQAKKVGVASKPESYYFPVELNSFDYHGDFTFFGLEPGTTREELKTYLDNWGSKGDNNILELSRAYKLTLGTGWSIPAGILHAPGSLVTYEPQLMSDTSSFWQSMVHDKFFERELLVKFIEEDKKWDLDYLIDCLDWEANTDPDFKKNHYCPPIPVDDESAMENRGFSEYWISYGSPSFSAKRLVVQPGREVIVKDNSAYGFIAMNGYGMIEDSLIETPACIRYKQLTRDEYFVTYDRAVQGARIKNLSDNTELVLLKHFGADNPDAAKFIKNKS